MNNKNIEEEIKLCILKYIESYTNYSKIKAYLSGITYKKVDNTNTCNVLILFDNHINNNNDEWINHFLSFPQISKILDKQKQNYFTQLCST